MRNFKDLSRALASIAGGLKSIKDIIDTIEPGGSGGSYDITDTEVDTGFKYGGKTVYVKRFHFSSWDTSPQNEQVNKDIGVLCDAVLSAWAVVSRSGSGSWKKTTSFPLRILYHAANDTTVVNFSGFGQDTSVSGQEYDVIIYYTKVTE